MAKSRAPHIGLRPFTGEGTSSSTDVLCNAYISSGGSKFKIKLTKSQIQIRNSVINVTGDTNTGLPGGTFTRGGKMYPTGIEEGRVTLQGHVVQGSNIGLTNLSGQASIGVSQYIGEDSNKRKLTYWLVPEQVQIDWDYTLPFVGLAISGPLTNDPTVVNGNDMITESSV